MEVRPKRQVVTVSVPPLVANAVGRPGLHGLSAFRERRGDVFDELLLAGLAIDEAQPGA